MIKYKIKNGELYFGIFGFLSISVKPHELPKIQKMLLDMKLSCRFFNRFVKNKESHFLEPASAINLVSQRMNLRCLEEDYED